MLLTTLGLVGCGGPSGPASTDTSSDFLPSLERRVEFLERYVTFRRGYRDLGFLIAYQNNGGGMAPGPSEWDVRLVAAVPPAELAAWAPPGLAASPSADTQWLAGVPGEGRAAGRDQGVVHRSGVGSRHRPRAFGRGVSPLDALAMTRRTRR
jgi:hypothetical protein